MWDHRRRHLLLRNIRLSPGFVSGMVIVLSLVAFAACSEPVAPTQTVAPTVTVTAPPSATPAPTWTPTPIPTTTPSPPGSLEIVWPDTVSPLDPLPVEVVIVPPPGIAMRAQVEVTVMDPEAQVYTILELTEQEGNRYRAPRALRLPLDSLPGYWWLIAHVTAPLPVAGDPARFFEVAPVVFRDLSEALPPAVTMRVPADFTEAVALGDPWAGGRVWTYRDGEVALWWVPGPTKAFLLSNALVVLEATYAEDARQDVAPSLSEALPIEWLGRPGFEFPEVWPAPNGGPGRVWVIQDNDYWLYVLRVRGVGTDAIPALHEEIVKTFAFVEATD